MGPFVLSARKFSAGYALDGIDIYAERLGLRMSATASPDEEYYSEYDIPEVNVPGATISTVVVRKCNSHQVRAQSNISVFSRRTDSKRRSLLGYS